MQFYSCPCGGDLVLFELFLRSLSIERGTLVGYGPGRVITRETLLTKYLLDRHSLPLEVAVLTHDASSLAEGEDPVSNPAPLLSRVEKSAARAAGAVQKAEVAETQTKLVREKQAQVSATYNCAREKCPNCQAAFMSKKRLARHLSNGRGRAGARVQRRNEQDAGTTRARIDVRKQDYIYIYFLLSR
jgi:hypothetical protein